MLTRKQLADLVGTTKSELYFYEQRGLLLPDDVTAGGYRYYSESSVDLYRQIRQLQSVGYTLEEIRNHLDGVDGLTDDDFFNSRQHVLLKQLETLQNLRSSPFIHRIAEKKRYTKPSAEEMKD